MALVVGPVVLSPSIPGSSEVLLVAGEPDQETGQSTLLHLRPSIGSPVVDVGGGSPIVLLVASGVRHRPQIVESCCSEGLVCWHAALTRSEAVALTERHQPEVAIVDLGFEECGGPGVAVLMVAAARHLQVIFFADQNAEGEAAAARALGLERVFLLDELHAALRGLLTPLAELVRLRRRVECLERTLTLPPRARLGELRCGRVMLFEGERRYRETYLRTLLAEAGNRREAARRAGIPYTTLCDMMRKLGIHVEPEECTETRLAL